MSNGNTSNGRPRDHIFRCQNTGGAGGRWKGMRRDTACALVTHCQLAREGKCNGHAASRHSPKTGNLTRAQP